MARTHNRSVVGLDIEPGYVAAVETGTGGAVIERAAAAQLSPGVVRDGEVVDVATLASVLGELFTEHKLSKRVRIGVANQRIVMRTIDLPPLPDPKDLASAVRFQAQDHIPMPLDQVVLEHQSLGIVETPEGPRSRVVLVAARRDMIERLLEAARQAGLKPEGIDLSAFAMIRALGRQAGAVPNGAATLYLSIGGMTNLAIAVGSLCVFTRVIQAGSETMATELAERRGLTMEHAHMWLRHVGLVTPLDAIDGDTEIVTESRDVLLAGASRIADEVRNTIDFHSMQDGAARVQQVIATGPAVTIDGFVDRLRDGVGLPIDVARVAEGRPGAYGGLDADRLAVAAGLSVSEVAS